MHSMNYIGRFLSNFKEFYNDINAATLTGAIDVIVVEQPDGTFNCSPFHVRFGKLGVLRSREKVVDIEINGESQDIHMKLGESGEAFFVEELEDDDTGDIPEHLATSPIPVSELDGIYNDGCVNNSTTTCRRDSLEIENTYEKASEPTNQPKTIIEDNIHPPTNNNIYPMQDLNKLEIAKSLPKDQSSNFKISGTANDYIKTKGDSEQVEQKSNKKKRRTKKKNEPRKSISLNQLSYTVGTHTGDNFERTESVSDHSVSSTDSSDPELKEIQKLDTSSPSTSTPRKIIDPDFHFFSDTEVRSSTTGTLRPDSPSQIGNVQSDSEVEVQNRKVENPNNTQSWEWGGFPSVTTTATSSPTKEESHTKSNDQSMISNMFSFMKRSHEHSDGIYLSDLNSVDPEVAALYFNQRENRQNDVDLDCESGNGPSLAQSPNSAEGCKSIDSDFDYHIKGSKSYANEIAFSLCGWEQELDTVRFEEHILSFPDFCNNPMVVDNPNLVVCVKGKFYNWKVAGPIIASLVAFNQPLMQSCIDQLCNMHMSSNASQDKNVKTAEASRSWWMWARSKTSHENTPVPDTAKSDQIDQKSSASIEIVEPLEVVTVTDNIIEQPSIEDNTVVGNRADRSMSKSPPHTTSEKYRKTLRLSSRQIASLDLRDGMNEVEFSVTTAYQGTSRCRCQLYKWRWDDKIVISDIDGTITKSDVLGHILPIVGKDWAQSGVARLFNNISNNGYKLLYLSARAIGQARGTRDYLRSIKQGDLTMPDGPILLNPTSLITALHCEVIEKKPEQFKISCMSDIKALFPIGTEPFYAGYGNRINDGWAYRAVGIPTERIFTINPKGELKHELTQTFQSSYLRMTSYVDQLYPPIIDEANNFSHFAFWRDQVLNVEELPNLA